MLAHGLADAMGNHGRSRQRGETHAHRIDPRADTEACHIGQPLVERRHGVPEIRLGATDAGMAAADRPISALVPPHHWAVLRRRRSFAAHLVEAMALAVCLVAPGLDILAGIEMRAPLAIVVNG